TVTDNLGAPLVGARVGGTASLGAPWDGNDATLSPGLTVAAGFYYLADEWNPLLTDTSGKVTFFHPQTTNNTLPAGITVRYTDPSTNAVFSADLSSATRTPDGQYSLRLSGLPHVTGVVTNLAGSPSPNVSVSNTNGPAGGTTDTAGKFGFSMPAGTDDLHFFRRHGSRDG
ncbi:hypothetical protein, partial [Nocardioides flavus (ex Wang et al. 2016)]